MRQLFFLLVSLIFPVIAHCGVETYTFKDAFSGLCMEIPKSFELDEEESKIDRQDDSWWYKFSDPNQNVIIIEVEEYNNSRTLEEHFHKTLTEEEEEEEEEKIIFEGLEFKNVMIAEIPMTKCAVRALAISENAVTELLYLCDYLFVHDNFGFSIGVMKKDDGMMDNDQLDTLMQKVLQSIRFSE